MFNRKPTKIIINEAIEAITCALSSSGVIVSIEKKFAIWKIKSIVPVIINDFPLNSIYKIFYFYLNYANIILFNEFNDTQTIGF